MSRPDRWRALALEMVRKVACYRRTLRAEDVLRELPPPPADYLLPSVLKEAEDRGWIEVDDTSDAEGWRSLIFGTGWVGGSK